MEDFLLRNADEDQPAFCFMYVNQPAVVVGRNQCIYTEVNLDFCRTNNIAVNRRISGGGTVYHDQGNINIAFFDPFESSKVNSYAHRMEAIIEALKALGVSTYLNPRNALFCGDYKLSGTAQFTNRKFILTHCTLLFDTDLTQLAASISPKFIKAETRASASVPSATANLRSLLKADMNMDDFVAHMFESLNKQGHPCLHASQLPSLEMIATQVQQMRSFEWIYERSPDCSLRLENGDFPLEIKISKGLISEVFCKDAQALHKWQQRIGQAY
jgi:lipoate-protein ligase A